MDVMAGGAPTMRRCLRPAAAPDACADGGAAALRGIAPCLTPPCRAARRCSPPGPADCAGASSLRPSPPPPPSRAHAGLGKFVRAFSEPTPASIRRHGLAMVVALLVPKVAWDVSTFYGHQRSIAAGADDDDDEAKDPTARPTRRGRASPPPVPHSAPLLAVGG